MEELKKYLELVRAGMGSVDVALVLGKGEPVLPTMVVDNVTPTAIYVYNISNEQLPLVKAKYYPEEEREIIAVNSPTKAPPQWGNLQRQLLSQAHQKVGSDPVRLTASFNLAHYAHNPEGTIPVRYSQKELLSHLDEISTQGPASTQDTLDELD